MATFKYDIKGVVVVYNYYNNIFCKYNTHIPIRLIKHVYVLS